ncbi:MAG TPA: TatD family hydrolase [Candidatus Eisenbergiella merdipullorum]|uniref:TatD family hydrolase n=1 Tax=Candidatus Eisenbergiella merdipullorum TaxID=2838553 RepID=A0A9D2I6M2_9FIRM|nr:TatD family hydrolase [Candidatus Eisenbergiella merdipullorum]
MIFDSHAHYDDRAFDEDREKLLTSLPEKGIAGVVNAGASKSSIWKTLELSERYPYIYAAVGIHPEHAGELREEDMEWLRGLLEGARVVAVGEIGLDYHWDQPEREIQKKWFASQLALAVEEKRPVVIHSRDAAADTLELMKSEYGTGRPAYIHCFSYSKETAREFLDLGYMIGIGGVVTFKNARKIKEALEYIPMDRILLETDCPYLSPVPYRGERNSSLNLPFVAQQIAKIKGIEPQEVEEITCRNAKTFFGIETD